MMQNTYVIEVKYTIWLNIDYSHKLTDCNQHEFDVPIPGLSRVTQL